MGGNTAEKYDESKIKTLSSIEHIRLRTGMYIGRLGDGSNIDDGIYVLLKEVIDNSIDEFIMGHGKRIRVKLNGSCCSVRDYGRGIPLGKLLECVSQINTGAKYNTDVFMFSVGLNGVGTKAVNALPNTSWFAPTATADQEGWFSPGESWWRTKSRKPPRGTEPMWSSSRIRRYSTDTPSGTSS